MHTIHWLIVSTLLVGLTKSWNFPLSTNVGASPILSKSLKNEQRKMRNTLSVRKLVLRGGSSTRLRVEQNFEENGSNSIDAIRGNEKQRDNKMGFDEVKRSFSTKIWSFLQLFTSTETFFRSLISWLIDDPDICRLFGKGLSYFFWAYMALSILGTIGVDTKPLLSLFSVAGITLGFALKDILNNTFAGIVIILTRPFQRGDIITVDNQKGKVISIDLKYVRLQHLVEKHEILIPLSVVYAKTIILERANKTNPQQVSTYY